MENMIEVTGVNLIEAVKAAYEMSVPLGLGFLHAQPGGLTDDEAESLIDKDARIPVHLDYVKGRACKFLIHRDADGKLWTPERWYDHSASQLSELLGRLGVVANA